MGGTNRLKMKPTPESGGFGLIRIRPTRMSGGRDRDRLLGLHSGAWPGTTMTSPDNDMNDQTDAPLGYDVCPSCHSEAWKGDKLVIMEGTSTTKGSGGGRVSDPGAFSGGNREFWLSDRWFTWSYPLKLDMELETTTLLAKNIKELMVEQSRGVLMPKEPKEPIEPELFWPDEPEFVEDGELNRRFAFAFFLGGALAALVLFLSDARSLVPFSWDGVAIAGQAWLAGFVLIARPFYIDHAVRKFKYYRDIRAIEKAEAADADYQRNLNKWPSVHSEWLRVTDSIHQRRELLWRKARVCTRCGTAYLGPD